MRQRGLRTHFSCAAQLMTLFTGIKPELLRRALMRGTFLGGLGALIYLLAGVFLPLPFLKMYGWVIFSLGLFLIAWGFYPYRRLKRLEGRPNKITVTEDALEYYEHQALKLRLPLTAIQEITYRDEEGCYGLELSLRDSSSLFFPYFRESAYNRLVNFL